MNSTPDHSQTMVNARAEEDKPAQTAANVLDLQNDKVWWVVIILIFLLAFYTRITGFADSPLWFDESIEYWMASVPLASVAQNVAQSTHDPPLYSYFLHFWMAGGIDEFWLRVPSLIASLFSIAGMIYLGRMLSGRLVGLLAGILITVSAADVLYAHEVGQYSLMVCLTTWNLIFLYKAMQTDRWLWWGLWGFTGLLNIYSHYGAAIVIFATAVTTLIYHLWQQQWQKARHQIIIGAVVLLLLLPLILIIIPQQLGRLGATTLPFSYVEFGRTGVLMLLFHFASTLGVTAWPWPDLPRWLITLPAGLAIIISLLRTRKPVYPPVMLLVTAFVYFLISRTGAYFFAPTRHSLLLAPLLILTVAIGIAAAARWHRLAGIVLLLPLVLIPLWIPREPPEDLRTIAHYWQLNRQPEDATYVYYGAAPGFRYQLDVAAGSSSNLPINWYGQCFKGSPEPFCREDKMYYGTWTRDFSAEAHRLAVEEVVGGYPPRLWVIISHTTPEESATLIAGLEQAYQIVDEQRVSNAAAFLMEKR